MSMRDEATWDGTLLARVAEFVRADPAVRDVIAAALSGLKFKAIQRRAARVEHDTRCSLCDAWLLQAAIDLVRGQPFNMRLDAIVALFVERELKTTLVPLMEVRVRDAVGANVCYEIARGAPSP